MSISTTTLALLTALVTVSTTAFLTVSQSSYFANSFGTGNFTAGLWMTLSLANSGARPARLEVVNANLLSENKSFRVETKPPSPVELPAGAGQQVSLGMTAENRMKLKEATTAEKPCELAAFVINFRGEPITLRYTDNCWTIVSKLRDAH